MFFKPANNNNNVALAAGAVTLAASVYTAWQVKSFRKEMDDLKKIASGMTEGAKALESLLKSEAEARAAAAAKGKTP